MSEDGTSHGALLERLATAEAENQRLRAFVQSCADEDWRGNMPNHVRRALDLLAIRAPCRSDQEVTPLPVEENFKKRRGGD